MKSKKIILWIPVIAWMTMIFLFSAQDADNSSQTSSLPAEILARLFNPDFDQCSEAYRNMVLDRCQFIVRKLAHFSVYTVLGMLTYNAFRGLERLSFRLTLFFSALLCLLYAISDEFHQSFVPGRSCQLRDVLIDFLGTVFGIALTVLFIKLIKKLRDKRCQAHD